MQKNWKKKKLNNTAHNKETPNKDPSKFNLVDPNERNTVGVPSGGWVAIRFQADNPSMK